MHGIDSTLDYMDTLFKEETFDGVVGFSQGAMLAAIMCTMPDRFPLRFAMFFSGFLPRGQLQRERFFADKTISVPTLHVWGEADELTPCAMAKQLRDICLETTVVVHPEGMCSRLVLHTRYIFPSRY